MTLKENLVHISIYYIISVTFQVSEKRMNYSINGFRNTSNHWGKKIRVLPYHNTKKARWIKVIKVTSIY